MTEEHEAPHGRTVLVTGATGDIGRAVVADLLAHGYRVVGADLRAPEAKTGCAAFVAGDLADAETVSGVYDTLDATAGEEGVAGVVHLAAYPAPGIVSEDETLRSNVLAAYLALQEAGRRGIGRVVAASSLSAVGLAWADRDLHPAYVPVDEEHPNLTVDSYGLSKIMSEEAAAFTTRRFGTATVMLRFPFVGMGERLEKRLAGTHRDPGPMRRELWGWLHTEDAAASVRAALTAPLTGHHVVNVAAPDTEALEPSRDLLAAYHPGTEVRGEFGGHDSFFATGRMRDVLGFAPKHTWR
ncbi:NAD(P)-dependent oxidoreductase [Streptomyces sp. DSM 41982]|uniref:NAD(P)-dependent oxidoreductase n=1 Tax=Streptomyces evansiae TaxID=3075535 RepID=A0ABD5E4H8_9ACTN|nr:MULTISPECIES: NAD(P)-dependent oxidoreductase [unclassified Streptomyces]MDT0416335.1 NAD(P)-dependent oxidoreductase [Streptomyces sp. DSM 41982]SCE24527.1 Nucleoside-diphosphate-sugar epimerase [Streptomyces sp. SolWspMP-sol7th]